MTDSAIVETMLNNVFATAKRQLARRGMKPIELFRSWLSAEACDRGYWELFARVPVGRDLVLRIVASDRGSDQLEEIAHHFAEDLPQALANVERAKWSLRRYAGSVRRASEAAIAENRSLGLDLSLARVTFKKTSSWHLGQEDWRDASSHILAEVHINGLDHHLRPYVHEVVVEESEDVADEIARLRDFQKEHQDARDALRFHGASTRVDEITLRHMDRYGLDRIETLRTVLRQGHVNFEVTKKDGTTRNLSIGNQVGIVRSTIIDDGGFDWLGDRLSFKGPTAPENLDSYIGRPVDDICSDDLFSGMTFRAPVDRAHRGQLEIDQPLHFVDLDQGRFWDARLAA